MKKKIIFILCLIGCLASILLIVNMLRGEPRVVDMTKSFNELLERWRIKLPIPYKVAHFKERPIPNNEYGSILFYYDIQIEKKDVEALINDENLREMGWHDGDGLLEVRPPIDWWNTSSYDKAYRGSKTSSNSLEDIYINIIVKSNDAHMFVEALETKK